MIRIVHVVFSLNPGGLENGVINLCQSMDQTRFHPAICCLENEGAFARRLTGVCKVNALHRRQGFALDTARKLRSYLLEEKPDVVHSHNLGPLLYSWLATKTGDTWMRVHGEHGVLPPHDFTFKKRLLYKMSLPGCMAITTVSESLKQILRQKGFPAERLVAIRNGVDTDRFIPGNPSEPRKALGIPNDRMIIGIVGRLAQNKGHPALFKAFEGLAGQFPLATLLLVGDGPERSSLAHEAVKTGLDRRIIFAGHTDNPVPYYQAMDLMVLPSLFEGLSNVVLEAMSCGIPVIASNACGNAEVIIDGANGWLISPDSVSVQHLLEQLLGQPELIQKAGRHARQTALQSFSLKTMANEYSDFYAGLINKS